MLVLSFFAVSTNAQEPLVFTSTKLEAQENIKLGLAISADGSLIVAGGGPDLNAESGFVPLEKNTITIWDAATGSILHQFESTAVFVADVVLSPDGSAVVAASSPESVGIWDIESGELVRQYAIKSAVVDISADGALAISSMQFQHPTLWDFQTGEVVHAFAESTGYHAPVAFSPNSPTVAVTVAETEDTSQIIVWDTATSSEIVRLTSFASVADIEFSPDGQLLAVATTDKGILLFDVETGEIATEFADYQPQDGEATSVAIAVGFSGDGQQLLSSWGAGSVVLLDLETGTSTYIGSHAGTVWRVAFTPDGNPVSSSFDGTVKMWGTAD
jgi:WD40 repeat protein